MSLSTFIHYSSYSYLSNVVFSTYIELLTISLSSVTLFHIGLPHSQTKTNVLMVTLFLYRCSTKTRFPKIKSFWYNLSLNFMYFYLFYIILKWASYQNKLLTLITLLDFYIKLEIFYPNELWTNLYKRARHHLQLKISR